MAEALNKKRAEWAGFRYVYHIPDKEYMGKHWQNPGVIVYSEPDPPNFTESPDACFKWLVPEAQNRGFNIHIHLIRGKRPKVVLSNATETYLATSETLVLALCLAIDKLIDKKGE